MTEGTAAEFTFAFGLERARVAQEQLLNNTKRLVGPANHELIDAVFEVGFWYGAADMAEALDHDLTEIDRKR
jgi:hypothetical protein